MSAISRSFCLCLCLLAAVWSGAGAEETPIGHQPLAYIGYYHDGSGVFPNSTLVTKWNECDYQIIDNPVTGARNKLIEVPDQQNRQNIVYKVPQYNFCNGGVIIAGGKLFCLNDRAGYGYAAERPADFLGVELYCIDPATGEELWKRDLHHWDLVPGGAELVEILKEYNKRDTELYGAFTPLGYAILKQPEWGTNEEIWQRLAEPMRAWDKTIPATWAEAKQQKHWSGKSGYTQLHYRDKVQPACDPELAEMLGRLQKEGGYLRDPWLGCYDPLGLSMQTPVSDGEHIYVSTAFGLAACLDLEGEIVWKRWFGGGFERAPAIPSPILVDDLLIVTQHDPDEPVQSTATKRMALDKSTGKTVWTAPYNGSYQTSPVAMTLPIAGDSTQTVTVLYYNGNGVVLRAADGKQLLDGMPAAWTGRPSAVDGDILVMHNKKADGGGGSKIKNPYGEGWAAIRLRAESADKLVPEVLWQGKDWGWSSVVAHKGVVFNMEGKPSKLGDRRAQRKRGRKAPLGRGEVRSYDIETGELIAKASGDIHQSMQYTILAGDLLIGLHVEGESSVCRVSADGKTLQPLGTNRLGDQHYATYCGEPSRSRFSTGGQLFASGNRLFIRSQTHLYCIGDPTQKMVLSPQHR